jgi:RNA polymerase sigma factor (sigma-70 family)
MRSMPADPAASDEELLASGDTDAFGTFYDRHAPTLLGYFARRTHDAEVAADLTAETFASAIVSQGHYDPARGAAIAWLYTLAGRRLADYHRRGAVEQRTCRALAMERPQLSDDDHELIRVLGESVVVTLLAKLPPDQGDAVAARVVDGRDYTELAHTLNTSEAVVRKRVSRGLATLRRHLGVRP